MNPLLDIDHPSNSPDCTHTNSRHDHLSGRGENTIMRYVCDDCGQAETYGFEGDE